MSANIKDTTSNSSEIREMESIETGTMKESAVVNKGNNKDDGSDGSHTKEEQIPPKAEKLGTHRALDGSDNGVIATELTVISISDDDSASSMPLQQTKAARKRRSAGDISTSALGTEEEHFRLKRRKIHVAGAPRMPLTGYVRYMNDRRELLRKEQPSKTAMEHTKMIGEEWHHLSEERKAPYMKAAEVDKQRYLAELHTFLKAHPDVLACELAKNKPKPKQGVDNKAVLKEKTQNNSSGNVAIKNVKDITPPPSSTPQPISHSHNAAVAAAAAAVEGAATTAATQNSAATVGDKPKRKRTPTPVSSNNNSALTSSTSALQAISAAATPGEIPIFTNEFLEHNKLSDMELRALRKAKADLDQQNAVLEKHVENMKFGVEKLTSENDELEEKNRLLEIYLNKLKRKLAQAFAGLPLPTEPNGASVENIVKYMDDLYAMTTSNTACLNKAKDILRKLDLQIQF